jgi:predicted acetyltransferase
MSEVRVVTIPESEKSELLAELQPYLQELMQYGTFRPVDGEFKYKWLDVHWQEEGRWPFWAMANGSKAGFALVRRDDEGLMHMSEFYIRPTYRRAGLGLSFAHAILRRFPGTWIISEYRSNGAAVAFWRKVASPFPFSEREYVGDEGVPRLEQKVLVARA